MPNRPAWAKENWPLTPHRITSPTSAIAQIAAWVKRKTMKSGKQNESAAAATKPMVHTVRMALR